MRSPAWRTKKIWMVLIIILCGGWAGQAQALTIQQEEELGREFMKEVRRVLVFVDDPLIVDYVREVGARIVATLPSRPFDFNFYVIREDTYNAFAGPGGHIFINSGLLIAMEREDELAGILGHEIAHVTCRHIAERISRSRTIGIASLAGVVAGILLGSGEAAMSSLAAGQAMTLAYSREAEIQADQRGLDYMLRAGYHPEGLLQMLEKIRSRQWFGSSQVPTYLMTHPAVEARIAFIGAWLQANPDISTRSGREIAFAKAHARTMALYADEQAALRRFGAALEKDAHDVFAHYGMALTLARGKRRAEAIEHLQKALRQRAFDADLLAEMGRLDFLEGRYLKAHDTLSSALYIAPEHPEALFYLGRVQLETEAYAKAAASFQQLLALRPEYTEVQLFLGRAYGRQDDNAPAHYHLGMYHQQRGDLRNAAFQFRRALDFETDASRRAHLQERIKALEKELMRRR